MFPCAILLSERMVPIDFAVELKASLEDLRNPGECR